MKLSEQIKAQLLAETQFSASPAGGPGGQHVNRVSTKAELRFLVQDSTALNDEQKQLILLKLKNRINLRGELIVSSSAERSQWRNRKLAEERFFELIEKAIEKPRKRKKTLPTAASKLKRLEGKKLQSLKKRLRKPPQV
jgi:ribosome-associated protein